MVKEPFKVRNAGTRKCVLLDVNELYFRCLAGAIQIPWPVLSFLTTITERIVIGNPPVAGTVYVVDDDAGFRDSMQAMTESLGLQFRAFANKEEFRAFQDISRPSCLILDHSLVFDSNCVSTIDSINQLRWRMPKIVCTAYASVTLAVDYLGSGVCAFLEKPLQGPAIAAQILKSIQEDARRLNAEARFNAMRRQIGSLSTRQKEMLRQMSNGVIFKVIAELLDVSRRTIDIEKATIYRILQVDSQIALGIWISEYIVLSKQLNYPDENMEFLAEQPGVASLVAVATVC